MSPAGGGRLYNLDKISNWGGLERLDKKTYSLPAGGGRMCSREKISNQGGIEITTISNFQLMVHDNHNYNKNLQPYASKLRKEMTKAEACLWKYVLKAKRFRGYQFRRQRPVLKYIADFMCMELMLIIEVDGITHHWEETISKDRKKQSDLEAAGFTVLRFTDEEVLKDINAVHGFLESWIENKTGGSKSIPD